MAEWRPLQGRVRVDADTGYFEEFVDGRWRRLNPPAELGELPPPRAATIAGVVIIVVSVAVAVVLLAHA